MGQALHSSRALIGESTPLLPDRPRSGLGEAMDAHLPCLAWYRYAKVRATDGGPIRSLRAVRSEHLGLHFHIGLVDLVDTLATFRPEVHGFAACDASGTHPSALEAIYRAVSEALERWAWMDLSDSEAKNDFGFHHDPSSTGLAAYPGWTRRAARPFAFREALERFCLRSWWEGRLDANPHPSRLPGSEVFHIQHAYSPDTVVLLLQSDPETGLVTHGYACDKDPASAERRAWYEAMSRNRALQRLLALDATTQAKLDLEERKTLFFGSLEGQNLIRERLARPAWFGPRPFRLLTDTFIEGPWSRYASVWRCVAEAPSDCFRMKRVDYLSS